jgi:hypothetical protein
MKVETDQPVEYQLAALGFARNAVSQELWCSPIQDNTNKRATSLLLKIAYEAFARA